MRSIHVLRKPCSESTVAANVLRRGTGAINVDGCRIGAAIPPTACVGTGWASQDKRNAEHGYRPTAYYDGQAGVTYKPHTGGRWPANIIMQHLPTCIQTGTREEPGYTVNRFTDGAKPFGGGAGHPYESERLPPSTVPVWACGAGCPVAGLDTQSGNNKAAVRKPTGRPIYPTEGSAVVWNSDSVLDKTERGFDDEGGASRYFKLVGGRVTPSGGDRGGTG